MDELPLTRAYLESLANGDLLKMADNLGIDISQNPDRVSLIEELLEASSLDEDEAEAAPEEELTDLVIVESVPLPKHYNVTYIEVMIRDPFWAFVFWEVKAADKEQMEKEQDFNGYHLRVNLLKGSGTLPGASGRQEMEEVLTVQVKPEDTAWYLGFAPGGDNESPGPDRNHQRIEQNLYKVELCVSIGEVETVLAVSAPIKMPGLPESPKKAGERDPELGASQLVRLSGYGDFHVLRRNERPFRAKRDTRPQS